MARPVNSIRKLQKIGRSGSLNQDLVSKGIFDTKNYAK